jgi:hypothetical protein
LEDLELAQELDCLVFDSTKLMVVVLLSEVGELGDHLDCLDSMGLDYDQSRLVEQLVEDSMVLGEQLVEDSKVKVGLVAGFVVDVLGDYLDSLGLPILE